MGAEVTLKVHIYHTTNTWRNTSALYISNSSTRPGMKGFTNYPVPVHLPGTGKETPHTRTSLEKKLWSVEKLIAVQHWYAYFAWYM